MAPTRKSSKRAAGKKPSSKKRAKRKTSTKRRSKRLSRRATALKKTARKGLRAARGPIKTVLGAGEKTWEVLKSTTSQVVEGVKGTFGGDESSKPG